jgi:hypothetical protein
MYNLLYHAGNCLTYSESLILKNQIWFTSADNNQLYYSYRLVIMTGLDFSTKQATPLMSDSRPIGYHSTQHCDTVMNANCNTHCVVKNTLTLFFIVLTILLTDYSSTESGFSWSQVQWILRYSETKQQYWTHGICSSLRCVLFACSLLCHHCYDL